MKRVDYGLVSLWIALVLILIVWCIPLITVIFTSLKSEMEILSNPSYYPPESFNFSNYAEAWKIGNFTNNGLNSLLITIPKVIIGVLFSSMAVYVFVFIPFKFSKILFFIILIGSMVPPHVALAPIFKLAIDLGHISPYLGLNTYLGIILPYIAFGLPYQIFILRGFFKTIPKEIIEAARIDGASHFKIFWKIVLPVSLPALAALVILDFVATWNEFALALIILQKSDMATLPLSLMSFQSQFSSNYGPINASIVMTVLPAVIVYIMFQKYFISGLTSGAVK